MLKKFNLMFLLSAFAVILASVYLTFIVDAFTLNTWVKRIFVFCYFLIVATLLVKCCAKLNLSQYKLASLIALLGAIVTLVFAEGAFLPAKNEHTFYIQSTTETEDPESEYFGIILSGVTLDGEEVVLEKANTETNGKWTYEKELGGFLFTPDEASLSDELNANVLSITVKGESVKFSFKPTIPNNPGDALVLPDSIKEGYVRIYDEKGYDITLALADMENESETLEHLIDFRKTYTVFERILYNAGAGITMTFAYKLLFELVLRFILKKNVKKKTNT